MSPKIAECIRAALDSGDMVSRLVARPLLRAMFVDRLATALVMDFSCRPNRRSITALPQDKLVEHAVWFAAACHWMKDESHSLRHYNPRP